MGVKNIEVREGSIDEIIDIASQIPEFKDPYRQSEYNTRLKGKKYLALVATSHKRLVGFKLGYGIENETLYSWFGGVLPNYRQCGVAKLLAKYQEEWAKKQGFCRVRVKTRNSFTPMLLFAIKSGFYIVDLERHSESKEHRIVLEKEL